MINRTLTIALSILLGACHTPNGPQDVAGTVVPKNAVYTFSPESAVATVSFDLHVTNTSYEPAYLLLCVLLVEQRNNSAAEFENVFHASCNLPIINPILRARSDTTFRRSFTIEKVRSVAGAQYRASVVMAFGIHEPVSMRIVSRPFEPVLN